MDIIVALNANKHTIQKILMRIRKDRGMTEIEKIIHENLDITTYPDGKTATYNLPVLAKAIEQEIIMARIEELENYCTFDNCQQHTHSWHTKQDRIAELKEKLK
jgi:hypothetical protein